MIVATSDRLFIAAPAPDWLLWTAGTPSDWLLLMTAAVTPAVESCCIDLPLADFSEEYLKIIRLQN
jgi:hypothetical protein